MTLTRSARRLAIPAAAAFAVFAALLAWVLVGQPIALDLDIATWMTAHRTETGISLFVAIASIGSTFGLVAIALAAGVAIGRRDGLRAARWFATAAFGAALLYYAASFLVARSRPPLGMRLFTEAMPSFPSGHATQTTGLWLAAALLLAEGHSPRVRAGIYAVTTIVISAVCASRVYLCQHWATDVVAGAALATAWVSAVLLCRQQLATAEAKRRSLL